VFWISLRREHRRWTQQTEQAQQWLDRDASVLFDTVRHVSGWSPAQHLHHVVVVNQRILDQLVEVVEGTSRAATGRPNIAGYVVLLMGRLPRGRGRSPAPFRPPDTVDHGALAHRVAANHERLDGLADHLGALRRSDHRLPHPVLGELDAGEWVRFARIHTGHHHRIIRDILDAMRSDA
jgi:hypothetical protein